MKRFIEGADREQSTLLPESLEDWIDDSNPVRAVDVFVDGLNLIKLGFSGVVPEATGRPLITRRRCWRTALVEGSGEVSSLCYDLSQARSLELVHEHVCLFSALKMRAA
jgi:hypothetical protein